MSDRAFAWVRSRFPGTTLRFETLTAEASHRSFFRVSASRGGTQRVLMVSPPDKEQNGQFETLARVFAAHGLPVPEIIASRPAEGWYLLTDLGRTDLKAAYDTAHQERALTLALSALIRLQEVQDPAIPPYTAERFADELAIFEQWFAGSTLGLAIPDSVADVFRRLVDRTRGQLQRCVHRDYHCRNLLYDPASDRLGIVDFQDALIGPVSYDVASLLHDCYHTFDEATVARWTDFYLSSTDLALDPVRFREDVDYMAVQRQLKAVGIFARLKLRDGKTTHLVHIPPVLAHLRRITARHDALAPLADWLAALDPTMLSRHLERLAG